jgi:protein-disulfide isomerase
VEVDIEGAPARGPADAPVTLVAFSDFECPFCAKVTPTLERLADEYGGRVRVVFKHFPLPMHARAIDAHKAAQAAALQDAFWPMHDRIFADPEALDPESLRAHAEALALDLAAYDAALASPELTARIQADVAEGQRVGVRGTPSFVVNGSLFSGALPYEAMKAHVDEALVRAKAADVAGSAVAPAGAGR